MYSSKIFLLNVFHAELGANQDENFVNKFIFNYFLHFFFETIHVFFLILAWRAGLFAPGVELERLFRGLVLVVYFLETVFQKFTLFERYVVLEIFN